MFTPTEIQALSVPELRVIFDALNSPGVKVHRAAPTNNDAPQEVDASGNTILQPPAPEAASVRVSGYAYQLQGRERREYGGDFADIDAPLWLVLLLGDAPVGTPGFELESNGLRLRPLEDANDLGTVGVAWQVLCRAPGARHGV
ncbi:hypothetical protein [Deinococcus peraridilitoris]|uniref:Uncharacterized protein n=1 Tax=Deinococcus peraridilitoris (strain DSM 19664 / LMG 22246 / CIP 109416 / KR-200) TaxID=937777 RepID=L0A247_DEIPD|nr:hypothetical protein [Deinococcus peraridilitoris]AFZ67075.1 hypothetical protein Deipe_1534 [Deinococcus peraridilitoris DSM 19664]